MRGRESAALLMDLNMEISLVTGASEEPSRREDKNAQKKGSVKIKEVRSPSF